MISEDVRTFIVNSFLFGSEVPFSDEDSFIEKNLVDSTGMLELISFIEARYNISVLEEEIIPENLDSVRRVSEFVAKKLSSVVQRT